MSNLKDELVGAYNKVVKRRDEFLHNSKVWIFRFKEIGEEDDEVIVFSSKPSREQMDEILLEHLDQLFFDNKTHPDQERANKEDPNKFHYPLYSEDLWESKLRRGQ